MFFFGGEVVIAIGFEPMTVCLEGRCSIQLSYATFFLKTHLNFNHSNDTLDWSIHISFTCSQIMT